MSPISTSDLFKRQITLSEIGEAGQQKLQESKVLVVGCGGLGSPIARYKITNTSLLVILGISLFLLG